MNEDSEANTESVETVKSLNIVWQPRPGVTCANVKTYGFGMGSEFVYCYTYPTQLEIAQLKQETHLRIKVGSAKTDPISRIFQQLNVSKTALSEPAIVLLVFRTLSGRHLESWLHNKLERLADAGGNEWFRTNPDELIKLFKEYVHTASSCFDVEADMASSRPLGGEADISPGPTRETRNQQAHRIQDEMSSGNYTSEEISQRTGISLKRVLNHVNFEIGKGRAELNQNGQVVELERPRRMARPTGQHRRDESGRSAKDHVLEHWVRAMLEGKAIDVEGWSHQFGVETITVRSWISCWKNYKGDTFTGKEGWPRITRSIFNEVVEAIRLAKSRDS